MSRNGHGSFARRTTVTTLAVTLAACAPACAAAAASPPPGLHATLPSPIAHADPADAPSPLDLASAAFGQTGARFELRVRTTGPLRSSDLAKRPGRSLCLTIEQRAPGHVQRLCLVSAGGRLAAVESRRRGDGAFVAPHPVSARFRRTRTNEIVVTFTPRAARLTPGRVVWRMTSDWAGVATCPPPAAGAVSVCHDVLPDTGGFATRVHVGYIVGCVPSGASKRFSGPAAGRHVALTFDDGPGPQTAAVLRILRRSRIHATFFDLGVQARLYPALVRRTLAEGHVVGNHTWDHRAMTSLSAGGQAAELDRTTAAIHAAAPGRSMCLFRPPGGAIDDAVARVARNRKLLSILWDVDPQDWRLPGAGAIVTRVLGAAHAGSIVLLHDAGGPRSQTLAALPQIIAGLRARHFTFVTVPELLGLTPVVAWD